MNEDKPKDVKLQEVCDTLDLCWKIKKRNIKISCFLTNWCNTRLYLLSPSVHLGFNMATAWELISVSSFPHRNDTEFKLSNVQIQSPNQSCKWFCQFLKPLLLSFSSFIGPCFIFSRAVSAL